MSYMFFYQSLETATLTYSATPDTNYPITNLQDRCLNTFFRDSEIGRRSVTIKIDFGSPRRCDYILFGNYLAYGDGETLFQLKYGTADNGTDFENTATSGYLSATSITNLLETFKENSKTKRYWQIQILEDAGFLDIIQIATIYIGTMIELSHDPELNIVISADYPVKVNQGVGGIRSGAIDCTTRRVIINLNWKYLNSTDCDNLVIFRDAIFMNSDLSRYPFWVTSDSGANLEYMRTRGRLELTQMAYQAWQTNLTLEEEL